jgi:hypothetical protein
MATLSYKQRKKQEMGAAMGGGGEGGQVRQRPKHISKAIVVDPEGELVSGNIKQGEDEGVKEEVTMVAEEPPPFRPYKFVREQDDKLEDDEAARLKQLQKIKKQKDKLAAYENVDLPPPPAPFCKLFDPRMVKGDIGKGYTVGIFGALLTDLMLLKFVKCVQANDTRANPIF